MLATIPSATLLGVEGRPITVEVQVANGLPCFNVVGLPDLSCREARDRVRAALSSSELPWQSRRITVNLAPSSLRKGGAGLDLPMAVALLVAGEVLRPREIEGMAFLGELGLDGSLRRVPGVVPLVDAISEPIVVVPPDCAWEAGVLGRHQVRTAANLRQLVEAVRGERPWPLPPPVEDGQVDDGLRAPTSPGRLGRPPDLADVRGQRLGRWALEVAAAGGHHLLLSGPPGAGKTMLARRLPGLLPPLATSEALEVTRVHSAAGLPLPGTGLVRLPPFRAPHHAASAVSLIGGGTIGMRPGEISAAHRGVLFLDELGEFPAAVLDMLRQPLEEGVVRVSRARASVVFPARFLLVAAMNPCPCGEGSAPGRCRCSDGARMRYANRVSGPLLDRFDLRVQVERPDITQLLGGTGAAWPPAGGGEETTAVVGLRVAAARAVAAERGVGSNADLPAHRLDEVAPVTAAARSVLEARLRQGTLSARGLHRVRRVARTLADLDARPGLIEEEDVCAALMLRSDPFPLATSS